MTTHTRVPARRVIALLTAALLALALTAPASALETRSWPVAGQGPANTSQASVEGPSDPGIMWAVDLENDTDLSFGTGTLHNPVLHPDGVLVRRAQAGAFDEVLVGVSASDGSVLWQLGDIAGACMPAVDSQDRLWVARSADADDDLDVRFVQQVDALNGEPVDGTAFALDPDAGLPDARNNLWCHGSSLHVAGSGASEVLIVLGNSEPGRNNDHVAALDLSGTAPSLAWTIDADTADDQRILADVPGNRSESPQARVGAFTDSHWLLPVLRNGEPHLDRITLADGNSSPGPQIPVFDEDDGSPATGTNPWSARTLIVGDTVVVSLRHNRLGNFSDASVLTTVHGFALDNLSLTWSESTPRRTATANAGATVLAATDGLVAYTAGIDRLFTVQRSTGAPTNWSGDLEIRELGANATPNILADSAGNLYVIASRDAGTVLRLSPTGQEQWRFSSNALELATGIAPGTDAQLALIDGEGTLYLVNEGRMYAIDSSGGLEDCVLPFDDVDEDRNVHAANICRLVQLGITGGTSPTTYDPRGDVTRAQMASFLARALGLDPIANPPDPFPDVEPGSTHAGNINAIRTAGITEGRADGTYDPGGTVIRAEMASFLARAAGLDPVVGGTGFNDVNPNNVHTPNIYAVRDAEITTGITASTFEPTRNVSRDQMASFLIRMLDVLNEEG